MSYFFPSVVYRKKSSFLFLFELKNCVYVSVKNFLRSMVVVSRLSADEDNFD